MVQISKIPFYLPLNTQFSTSSIITFPLNYGYSEPIIEDFIGDGSYMAFMENLDKYLVTTQFGNVIKEHVFVRVERNSSILYPIIIKTYPLSNTSLFGLESSLLIRKGIEEALRTNFIDPMVECTFKSSIFIDYAIRNCDKYSSMHDEDLLSIESILNTLKFINNEAKPDCMFDLDYFIYSLTNPTYNPKYDEFSAKDCPCCEIYSQFSPSIMYNLFEDYLTAFSMVYGRITEMDLTKKLHLDYVVKDDILQKKNVISENIENTKDEYVVFAGSSENYKFGNNFEVAIYEIYEVLQNIPCTDLYMKFILQSGLQANLSSQSQFANRYTRVNYTGLTVPHTTWIKQLTSMTEELVNSLKGTNNFLDITINNIEVEIIYQDYHALIIIRSAGLNLKIILDMVVLAMLSKTIILEPSNM